MADRPNPPLVMPQSAQGWSVDTLREYVESRLHELDLRNEQRYQASQQALSVALASLEKAMQAALTAADRAVSKAETAAEKRFDSVNEFRGLVNDLISKLLPRAEAEVIIKSLDARLDLVTSLVEQGRAEGSGVKQGWGYAVGVTGLVLGLLGIVAGIISFVRH